MAVKIVTIDLSTENPQLSPLTARAYTNKYTAVPNVKLPADLIDGLSTIYRELTGNLLPLDDATLAISATDGLFHRLYPPKLYARDGEVYIKWGSVEIPLVASEDGLQPAFNGTNKVALSFTTFNPSGKGSDPGLEIKVTIKDGKDSTIYTTVVSIAPKDWKNYNAGEFNAVLETDPESLAELLTGESSGGSIEQLPTIDRKYLLTQVFGSPEEQTRPLELDVVNYRMVPTSYGQTAIFTVKPSTDEDVTSRCPETSGRFAIWADGQARKVVLQAKPTVTEDSPAKLVLPIGGRAVLLLPTTAADATGVNLDF